MKSVRILSVLALTSLIGFGASCNCGDPAVHNEDGGTDASTGNTGDGGGGDGGEDAGPIGDNSKNCLPCTDDTACAPGARCVDVEGVLVCAALCDPANSSCVDGFTCSEIGTGESVCVPANNVCCVDGDGDGYGQGVGCTGVDCDEADPASFEGAVEVCDNKDNDCSGTVDDNIPAISCGTGACQVTVAGCEDGAVPTCTPGDPSAETCNGVDDDCNGQVDDGFGQTTCGIGACEVTVDNCSSGQTQTCTPGTPTAEVCNGIDDDCDGVVDQDLGQTTCGTGVCVATVDNCVNGQVQMCTPGTPGTETCNDLDDNCDGAIDEGLGQTTCGVGACAVTTDNCIGGQTQTCVPGNPSPETCNGLDDNCDGTTDEGLGQSTCGVGACTATVDNCVDGLPQTCTPGTPAAETCNNVDDDCDGVADNGLGTTTCGVGACQVTIANCDNGQSQTCVPGTPSLEVCDGIDNDCNGAIDDGDPGGGASCNTGNQGICAGGVTSCSNGAVVCNQSDVPAAETCDGIDNDCDGVLDNGDPGGGVSCNTGLPGVCGTGTTSCTNGAIACNQNVQSSAEICDGLDNDCDGQIDNGNPGGGQACGTGLQGVCAAGTTACTNGAVVCNQDVQPSAETCDGLDNDCNGTVDNGNPGAGLNCTTGQPGACSAGTTACTNGAVVCDALLQPTAETCDGIDNDCNGQVDDGNPGGGANCSTGQSGVCSAGTTACTGGALVCNQNVQPSAETCDGLDNDCDGSADDGNPGGGVSCSTGKQGVCAAGMTACTGGALVCNQNVQPSAEACDGLDNDCNGVSDNGNPGGGLACNTGKSGICAMGTTSCSAGDVMCIQNNQPIPEICNGVDDDCDGQIDEGNPGGGFACSTGQPGVCGPGTTVCSAGAVVCSQNVQPSGEMCDGLDNDCDGLPDDGNPGGGVVCNTGKPGVCAIGTTACTSGNVVCSQNVQPSAEVCDTKDNDCDGLPDNNAIISDGLPNSCTAANNKVVAIPSGGTGDVTGYIDPNGDDYFTVNFTGVGGAGAYYHPRIRFISNPSTQFKLQVFSSCGVVANGCTANLDTFEMSYPSNPGGCSGTYGNFSCTDAVPKRTTFIVRVTRVAGAPYTCTPYTVRIDNL